MKTIEILTENNVSITALVVYEHCDSTPAKDGWIYPEYICYAQDYSVITTKEDCGKWK